MLALPVFCLFLACFARFFPFVRCFPAAHHRRISEAPCFSQAVCPFGRPYPAQSFYGLRLLRRSSGPAVPPRFLRIFPCRLSFRGKTTPRSSEKANPQPESAGGITAAPAPKLHRNYAASQKENNREKAPEPAFFRQKNAIFANKKAHGLSRELSSFVNSCFFFWQLRTSSSFLRKAFHKILSFSDRR